MTMNCKKTISLLAASAAMAMIAAPTSAVAETKPAIEYYLTKTDVAVGLKLTLASCPQQAGELPLIRQEWLVEAAGVADPANPVKIDVSKGFLVKRSTAFTFNPNGTLAAFNSKAEGQGGAVLERVIKTAGAVAGAVLGVPPVAMVGVDGTAGFLPPKFVCTRAVIQHLDDLDKLGQQIRQLEDRMVLAALTAAETQLLERLRDARARTAKALTIVIEAPFVDQNKTHPWNSKVSIAQKIGKWFEKSTVGDSRVNFDVNQLDGIQGYSVHITPAGPIPKGEDAKVSQTPAQLLYYRRPVLAKVSVIDLSCSKEEVAKCTKTINTEAPLMIGQWGRIDSLKIGAGSIFGSSEAKAKFDEFGNPLELSYGSDSGGEGIASAIGTAGESAVSIADGDIVALEKAIKRAELRKKLDELTAD